MRILRLAALVVMATAVATPARAQFTLGAGGGGAIGERGGTASGAHAMAFLELKLPILPGLRVEGLAGNTSGKGTISLIASGVLEVPTPVVRPYVLAGWGTYGVDADGARGAWNVGVGARTALPTGASVFVEVRRHDLFVRDLLTIGVRL